MTVATLSALFQSRSGADLYFVDCAVEQGTNDGSSRQSAFVSLQDALAVAVSGDSIRVATGVYYPDEGTGQTDGDASSSFVIPEGVDIRGGWLVGSSPHHGYYPDSPERTPTILSGDLSQDDLDPDGNGVVESPAQIVGVNAQHVVTFPSGTEESSLTLVTISGGNALAVGRISGDGGGVHCSGPFRLSSCRVIGNAAENAGGGIFVGTTTGTISSSIISTNSAGSSGGGIYVSKSDPSISKTRFTANTAAQGGAIFNSVSSPSVSNCLISGNRTELRGGAIMNELGSNPSIQWCTLSGNSSLNFGGAVYNDDSDPSFDSVAIWNNRVGSSTTALASSVENSNSSPSFANCLIANSGGSLTWNAAIGQDLGENIDRDPSFLGPVSPAFAPTAKGDYRVLPGSPLVDAGGSGSTTTDVDSRYRRADGDSDGFEVADIGAHEMPKYIYVDHSATGAGTGQSWADAFVFLQDALSLVESGVEIRVAEGVYHPDEGVGQTDNDPGSTFQLGIEQGALVGGFPNGGGAQDIDAHKTVLSGDIDGNDRDLDGNGIAESTSDLVGGNATTVVTGTRDRSSSTDPFHLEGFVVTSGGGLSSSSYGGGLRALTEVSLDVDRCHFSGNYAGMAGGGAVFATNVRHLRFRNCRFTGNTSLGDGGAIYDRVARVTAENCLFAGNKAGGSGGAIVSTDGATLYSTVLDSCVFQGNVAGVSGGALVLYLDGNCHVTACTFSGNRCGDADRISNPGRGGAISVSGSDFTALGSVFWNNATLSGSDSISISSSNAANVSVFGWCVVSDGDVPWSASSVVDLGGNLDIAPEFIYPVDPRFAPTVVGDYRPVAGSPLIDAGWPKQPLLGTDITGRSRVKAGRIDIGAYEGSSSPIYVDGSAAGANDGSSWGDAYNYLADAIAAAVPEDVILVAAGVYFTDEGASSNPDDARFSFHLREEVSLVGGFPNGGGARDLLANVTILSGDIGDDDVDTNNDGIVERYVGVNSFCVVDGVGISAGSSLDGFTITGGVTQTTNGVNGGGLNLNAASPSIFECHFSGNWAHSKGGAIWCGNGASPSLIEVSCSNNHAFDGGAVAADSDARPIFRHCTFTWNSAKNGGAVHSDSAFPEFYACAFSANDAVGGGGGCLHAGSGAGSGVGHYMNCAWWGNKAGSGGAILGETQAHLSIINGTIAGNLAGLQGGGLYLEDASAKVRNSIIWGNLALAARSQPLRHSVHVSGMVSLGNVFSDCLIAHANRSGIAWDDSIGSDGGGNDGADPMLALVPNPSSAPTDVGELHFLAGSPALNRGNNIYNEETLDLAGAHRIDDGTIDVGAYEGAVDPSDQDEDGIPDYWERAYHGSGSIVDPDSDDDNDDLTAFAEFALGLNPLVPNAPAEYLQSTVESDGGMNYLTLYYRKNPAASGLITYRVVRSIDLGTTNPWSSTNTTPASSSSEGWDGSRSMIPMTGQLREFLKLDLSEAP